MQCIARIHTWRSMLDFLYSTLYSGVKLCNNIFLKKNNNKACINLGTIFVLPCHLLHLLMASHHYLTLLKNYQFRPHTQTNITHNVKHIPVYVYVSVNRYHLLAVFMWKNKVLDSHMANWHLLKKPTFVNKHIPIIRFGKLRISSNPFLFGNW